MAEANLQMERSPGLLDRPLGDMIAINWEKAGWLLLIAFAVITRFAALDARVISHDESLHTYYSWQLYKGRGFQHTPLMHGPFQFHAVALSYFLFGDNDFTARVPSAVFGVAAIALCWYFRRWLGRVGALAAGLLMVISPYMLYYARYVRNESFMVVWALLMAIAMFRYFETRRAIWLYVMVGATAFAYTTKEVTFIYVALWMTFLGVLFLRDMFQTEWRRPDLKRYFTYAIYLAAAAIVVVAVFGAFGRQMLQGLSPEATVTPADPTAEVEAPEAALSLDPPLAVAGGVAGAALLAAAGLALISFRGELRSFASIDLLVILGTFVLPQLTAAPVDFILQADALDYSNTGLLRTVPVFIVLLAVSAGIGLLWDWRKWLISAGIFYGIYIPLYTTVFTNGNGFATGMVGSLGYWLDQQGVRRGNQPWYYYIAIQTVVYEYLPAIGSLLAAGFGLQRWLGTKQSNTDATADGDGAVSEPVVEIPGAQAFPVLVFIGFWMLGAFAAYTAAGEKMPWLTVHMTLPMILLAGWAIGKLATDTNWQELRNHNGWMAALLLPLALFSLFSIIARLAGPNPPFRGNDLAQLEATMAFLSALVFFAGVSVGLYYATRNLAGKQIVRLAALEFVGVLGLLTARAAFVANYVNYDLQTEFINYASGAPGVAVVMDQVEEISRRTTDGLGIRVAYDDDTSWPMTWYLRNYTGQVFYGGQPSRETFNDVPLVIAGDSNWSRVEPLLGDQYYSFEYIRMWWPMQDYFGLTWDRIRNAFTDPNYRAALWDIWYARDYTRYGELTNVDYHLSKWPVVDRMRFYVRRDLAAQLWDLGVGPTVLAEPPAPDPFESLWQPLSAATLWGGEGNAAGQFQRPRDIAVAPDGSVFVADTSNHRIQVFDADGTFKTMWGTFGNRDEGTGGPGAFNEPWGIAVDADGSVYVADTWNHRIQKFTPDGAYVLEWGQFGTDGALTSMWGPRDVATGPDGRVYVADSGNKRILVFEADGTPVRQIGSGGVLDGELDEPVGVAIAADGRVFVADTWNQRVQVFTADGLFLHQWDVQGWFGQSLENKPYLGLDNMGRVFVSDPEGFRILVYDEAGLPQFSFGDFGFDNNTFALPVGVAWDGADSVFVVDSNNHRVMKFQVGVTLPGGEGAAEGG